MRPFDTLIELSENQLDEKRKELAALEQQLARAIAMREELEAEVAREQAVASQDVTVGFTYGAYAGRVIQRRSQADAAIARLDAEVEAAREVVREAFAELRRYEMAHEQRLEKLRKEQAAREQIEMDEIAGNLMRRKNERL